MAIIHGVNNEEGLGNSQQAPGARGGGEVGDSAAIGNFQLEITSRKSELN